MSSKIAAAYIEVSADTKPFRKEMEDARNEVKSAVREISDTVREMSKAISQAMTGYSAKDVVAEIDKITAATKGATGAIDDLNSSKGGLAGNPTAPLAGGLDRVTTNAGRAKEALDEVARAATRAGRA